MQDKRSNEKSDFKVISGNELIAAPVEMGNKEFKFTGNSIDERHPLHRGETQFQNGR